jgi:CRP-like cAMP-binding protein
VIKIIDGIISLIIHTFLMFINISLLVTLTQFPHLDYLFQLYNQDIVLVVVEVVGFILSTITTLGMEHLGP